MAAAYRDEAVIAVGGLIEPVWATGRPGWFPGEFDWVVGSSHAGLPRHRATVRNVTGANMSFRREELSTLGGFEARFGRCCDETELSIRARKRWPNRPIVYDPTVRVRHRVPAERARWRYFVDRCYLEGRMKATVAKLHGGSGVLTSEREHAIRVLPWSVFRGLRQGISGSDPDGPRRAGAILAGLVLVALGYAVESARLAGERLPR
jgi:hypothetical protein